MVSSRFVFCLALGAIVWSCRPGTPVRDDDVPFAHRQPDSVFSPRYAHGFSISYYDSLKRIEIKNPWDSTAPPTVFIAGPGRASHLFDNSATPFIPLPVSSWACFSSTQVVFAEALGVLETLKSVAEPQYISNRFVQHQIKQGKIRDVGPAVSADVEVLLDVNPQFIFVSPFMDNRYGPITETGLVVVPDAGYLEQSPLGRAEWVVLFAAFFDGEDRADSIFKAIEKDYLSVKQQAWTTDQRPSVITGTLYQDIWYLPAGDSFMAQLFADAASRYPYRDVEGTGSQALDFETVFNDTWQSDYWVMAVNHHGTFRATHFLEMDSRYADFKAFKNDNVLFTNTAHSQFYERGVLDPHVILKDLASYFHPGLFPGYKPVYFERLKP